MYKLPERGGAGRGGDEIWAMPERKHSFFQEVFPNVSSTVSSENSKLILTMTMMIMVVLMMIIMVMLMAYTQYRFGGYGYIKIFRS